MRKMLNKILNVFVLFIALILIVVTGYKFLRHEISVIDLVLIELILIASLFALFFMVLDKVSTLNEIINKQPQKIGDIALNFWGFLIGLAGIYMFLFWKHDKTTKIFILGSSLFFIAGSMYTLFALFLKSLRKRINKK